MISFRTHFRSWPCHGSTDAAPTILILSRQRLSSEYVDAIEGLRVFKKACDRTQYQNSLIVIDISLIPEHRRHHALDAILCCIIIASRSSSGARYFSRYENNTFDDTHKLSAALSLAIFLETRGQL